jgi:hypothetical protein
MAARASSATTAAAVFLLLLSSSALVADAGQNCICECVKLCVRADIPSMRACTGKCRENACVKSCEEACTRKGFPKLPPEGISLCELEPLTPDEEHMLPH